MVAAAGLGEVDGDVVVGDVVVGDVVVGDVVVGDVVGETSGSAEASDTVDRIAATAITDDAAIAIRRVCRVTPAPFLTLITPVTFLG